MIERVEKKDAQNFFFDWSAFEIFFDGRVNIHELKFFIEIIDFDCEFY